MNLKVNRKIVSKEPDERVIRETMAGLPLGKRAGVELRRGQPSPGLVYFLLAAS